MKYLLTLLLALALIVAVFLFRNHRQQLQQVAARQPELQTVLQTAPAPLRRGRPASMSSAKVPLSPEAFSAELALMEWAAAAKPFNFDPVITGYQHETNRHGEIVGVVLSTRTHTVDVSGSVVMLAVSHHDTDRATQGKEKWSGLTGAWTEAEAIAETRAILGRFGQTPTLATATNIKFDAVPWQLPTADGKTVTMTPFTYVYMHNADGDLKASAQYRMEASGPGLVRWFHWP